MAVCLKRLSYVQAAAFDGWVEAVHTFRHKRQIVAKALKRIINLKLSQVFSWWRDQAAAVLEAHAKAAHIIARMQNQCLAAAFNSWADEVSAITEAGRVREQLVEAAASKNQSLRLAQMFSVSCTS